VLVEKLRTKIMQEKHDVPMDLGEITIKVTIGKKFYWLRMKKDILHFVRTFIKC
jgi:hypothetical protein